MRMLLLSLLSSVALAGLTPPNPPIIWNPGPAAYIFVPAIIGVSGGTGVNQANGGWSVTTRTITGSLTVDTTTTDYAIFVNTTSAINITMPAATTGRTFIVKDISGAPNITFVQHASETLEGLAASKKYTTPYGSVTWVSSDGTNWWMD